MKRLLKSYQTFLDSLDIDPEATLGKTVLAGLIASEMVGMVLHNNHRDIAWFNETFLAMINPKKVPLPPVFSLHKLTPKEYLGRDAQMLTSTQSSGTTKPYEKMLCTLDGSCIDVVVSHTRLRAKGKIFLSLFLNITKSKRLEQLKNDFISIAGHELKTPLTSMRAYTQMLQKTELTNDTADYVSKMLQLIDRQNYLINELLDLSKIESDTIELFLERVALRQLVVQVVDDFHIKFPARKIMVGTTKVGYVMGDRNRILQIVSNLISNALKYSPEHSTVSIEFKPLGTFLEVAVKDKGIGIKKTDRKKLFMRYSRIQAGSVQGLGLGLFITKKIVEQLGGKIGLRANRPQGSIFFFTLPVAPKRKP